MRFVVVVVVVVVVFSSNNEAVECFKNSEIVFTKIKNIFCTYFSTIPNYRYSHFYHTHLVLSSIACGQVVGNTIRLFTK